MTKRQIYAPVVTISIYDFEGNIGKVVERLQKYQEQYPNASIDISLYESYGSVEADVYLMDHREETDKEYNNRITQEKRAEDYQRKQFEELKKKFG